MKPIKRSSVSILIIGAILALACVIQPAGCSDTPTGADGNRDLILVLDTSRSMVGQGGKNIFPQVKDSLKKFIDELKQGDSLTIMTFDENVKAYPTMSINDDNDKILIGQMISNIEAKGMWTYTMQMLRDVFKMAGDLEKKGGDRKQVIVMLTDGLDDPPPSRRKELFNIRDAAKGYVGKEWYIYLVNFGDLKKNERFQHVQSELMKSVTSNVKLVEGGKSPTGAVGDVQQSLQQQREIERSFFASPLFIAVLVILALLIVLFMMHMYSKIKVAGSVEYYNYSLLDPYVNVVNLNRYHLRAIKVGKSGVDFNIRDFESAKPFIIKAERFKGKIVNKLVLPEGAAVEFVNREAGEFLNDGDVFKIANYSFKYMAQQG